MKGYVYQIYIESNPNIHYVGSTSVSIQHRWKGHHDKFKEFLKDRRKATSISPYFESLGIENFNIRLIKEYDVVDKHHLMAYEQLWINKLKPINIIKVLFKTRHIIRAIGRINRLKNREKEMARDKKYYNQHKEKILEKCKTYYDNNSEKIKQRVQNYRENNQEKVRLRKQKKYFCLCSPNEERLFDHKSRHERTLKHQKYLQSIDESKQG